MKKAERLNGIIFALNERKKLTASELSEMFEVSVRTIYRDIDALCQLKVPIISYDGLNGGYEINSQYFIPSIMLNEKEITMLLMVLKVGEELKLPDLTADYQLLRSKIINAIGLSNNERIQKLLSHIHFCISKIDPTAYCGDVLSVILESFKNNIQISMEYYSPKKDSLSVRNVSPTQVFYEDGGWYLQGYCHLRKGKRIFRLDRIKKVQIEDTQNKHIGEEISSLNDKFIVKKYVMEMDSSLYRIIKDNDYMKKHKILEDNNPMKIEIETGYAQEITNIVLDNPNKVTILEPLCYVDEITNNVKKLYEKYL